MQFQRMLISQTTEVSSMQISLQGPPQTEPLKQKIINDIITL